MEGQAQETGLIVHDGFMFHTRRTVAGVKYLVCTRNKRFKCPASAKLSAGGDLTILNVHHNHQRQLADIASEHFKIALRQACASERGTLKTIYDRTALRNPEGAVHVQYNKIRSSMRRWKLSNTPNVPKSLEELSQLLQNSNWPRYNSCSLGAFYSGNITADGSHAIIFGNTQFVQNFSHSLYTFIDGTFKAVPRQPHFSQILTIFSTCMDHAFPLIHVFMERRTKSLYDAVFNYIKEAYPSFVNNYIVTDYETALVESLRGAFPQVTLRGCLFHYSQAVFRKAKALGILRRIEGNARQKKTLRKYYALALLPPDRIEEGLNHLQGEHHEIFDQLQIYIRRQWIGRITPDHFSVFGATHRTNNVMEAYHRRLNDKLVRHPGIWDLMETLIDFQNIAALELEQLEKGAVVFRVAKKNELFDSRLNQAWEKLMDGRFTIGDFFRQAVHFMENLDNLDHEEPVDLDILPPSPTDPRLSPARFDLPLSPSQAVNPSLSPASTIEPPHLSLSPIEPLLLPDAPPSPTFSEMSVYDRPRSVSNPSSPIYLFPEIPEEVGRAFARFDEDEPVVTDEVDEHERWKPQVPRIQFDEESMSPELCCRVCLINKVQYVVECGHVFCGVCAARLFNRQNRQCAICRALLHPDVTPKAFYLN